MIRTPSDIQSLGTILSVWAHPDDETFTAAGVLMQAVANGRKVVCVTATKGEAGSQDIQKWPPETLGEVREKELKSALKVLGIDNHHFLGYRDGECEQVPAHEAATHIKKLIIKYKPDTILTFGPEGMTGHPDHCCVFAWVSLAVSKMEQKPKVYHVCHTTDQYEQYLKQMDEKMNIFFNIEKPKLLNPHQCDIYFDLPDELQDRKYQALQAMPSQMEMMMKLFEKELICKALSPETFVLAKPEV